MEERGRLDISLTVRTAPENITPSRPKFFDSIFFGGAEPGMVLTMSNLTWLKPVFYAQPTEGSTLSFADVCAHQATQMDLISAIRQMYNLQFYTDPRARIVRIEPIRTFHFDKNPTDWTSRIDLSRPIQVEELGSELAREMVWSYRSGDNAVSRFNRTNGGQLGRWSTRVDNTAAADSVRVWENAMFTPSLTVANAWAGAPSALVLQAGSSSTDEGFEAVVEATEDLNFLPKIVRYEGMKALPTGESWGWPVADDGAPAYPKAAFHAPESGYTLCFEDRDGCTGLHTAWDQDVGLWNNSRRVTLWLALSPTDVENIWLPTGYGVDFRSTIALTIDGEHGLYRLEEIVDYDPAAVSTKCVLVKSEK